MWKRKLLTAALAAASIAWMPLPASAADFYLSFGPPEPQYEAMPAARPGYVWSPGYHDWRNGRHVWVRGHWVRERRGAYWHPNRWVERDGRWFMERGDWRNERYAGGNYSYRARDWQEKQRQGLGDRDRDGVKDRYDRDRDGDGVPNRADNRPNNPYRQ